MSHVVNDSLTFPMHSEWPMEPSEVGPSSLTSTRVTAASGVARASNGCRSREGNRSNFCSGKQHAGARYINELSLHWCLHRRGGNGSHPETYLKILKWKH